MRDIKSKKPNGQLGFVCVPKAGIEPARPKAHDFESCASTSSATQACLRQSPAKLTGKQALFFASPQGFSEGSANMGKL